MVVPFRESKLTTLFQHALSGEESVTMIVNVSPESSLFDETQQVLRSSAVAKSIISRPLKKLNVKKFNRSRRFTRTFLKFVPEEDVSHQPEFTETSENLEKEQENIALIETLMKTNCSLKEENEKLKKIIDEMKEKCLELETDVRAEVVSACTKRYDDIREKDKARIADAEKRIEELCQENFKYKRLLERAETRPVSMIESGVNEENDNLLREACEEIKICTENEKSLLEYVEALEKILQYKNKNKDENEKFGEQLKFDLQNCTKQLEEIPVLKNELESLRIELKEKESIIENQRVQYQTEIPLLIETPSTSCLEKKEEKTTPAKSSKTNLKIPGKSGSGVGQNIYACEFCSATYKHERTLNAYRRVHSGATTCHVCRKILSSPATLKRHINVVHHEVEKE